MKLVVKLSNFLHVSPYIKWEELPPNTKDIVIQMIDPVTNKTHWLIYNLNPTDCGICEDGSHAYNECRSYLLKMKNYVDSSYRIEGLNDFGSSGYFPIEKNTNYQFVMFALSKKIIPQFKQNTRHVLNSHEILDNINNKHLIIDTLTIDTQQE